MQFITEGDILVNLDNVIAIVKHGENVIRFVYGTNSIDFTAETEKDRDIAFENLADFIFSIQREDEQIRR